MEYRACGTGGNHEYNVLLGIDSTVSVKFLWIQVIMYSTFTLPLANLNHLGWPLLFSWIFRSKFISSSTISGS